jgi:hypothetical protein
MARIASFNSEITRLRGTSVEINLAFGPLIKRRKICHVEF